ncbi:MAG: CDP-alcohol phosphatidyltransferase family protein [Candidatus Thermoplasmatota archaeon]|nr:CDP-alcohol phosphatidyltransferase family protein [Candidatus Thermoplasmatota archaeon]
MAFEKARGIHTKMLKPIVDRMSGVDPATLTWISVLFAAGSCYLLATATRDSEGAWRLIGAFALLLFAAELDALDGAVARAYDKVSKYGDWLDHTIDRLVDLSLLIAIGINTAWVSVHWLGWAAATMTLLGSYMGTQAQSVGLGRNYGGFSRADRLVTTFVGIAVAAFMSFNGNSDFAIPSVIVDVVGFDGINPLNAVLLISLVGGIWTFLTRAMSSRRQLLDGE